MWSFSRLVAWVGTHALWTGVVPGVVPFSVLFPDAPPPGATTIQTFFTNLSADLLFFSFAMAGFFFGLSALFYMASGATGNERTRQHAISALYAALAGLALALLASSITALISSAAGGK